MRRDARLNDAAVVGLTYPGNQGALLETVEKPSHIRGVGNHAVRDPAAGQTFRCGPTEDAEDIVLGAGKPRGFQKMFDFLSERVGGLQKRNKDAVLQGGSGAGRLEARTHRRNIVVITMIVKRQIYRPMKGRLCSGFAPRAKVNLAEEALRALRDDGFHGVGHVFRG